MSSGFGQTRPDRRAGVQQCSISAIRAVDGCLVRHHRPGVVAWELFAEDIVVERTTTGRYRAELSHDWDLVTVPQGWVIAPLALRAGGLSHPRLPVFGRQFPSLWSSNSSCQAASNCNSPRDSAGFANPTPDRNVAETVGRGLNDCHCPDVQRCVATGSHTAASGWCHE